MRSSEKSQKSWRVLWSQDKWRLLLLFHRQDPLLCQRSNLDAYDLFLRKLFWFLQHLLPGCGNQQAQCLAWDSPRELETKGQSRSQPQRAKAVSCRPVFKHHIMAQAQWSRARISSVRGWDPSQFKRRALLVTLLGLGLWDMKKKHKNAYNSVLWASNLPVLKQVISMVCIFPSQDETKWKIRTVMKRGVRGPRCQLCIMTIDGVADWIKSSSTNRAQLVVWRLCILPDVLNLSQACVCMCLCRYRICMCT